MSSTGKMLPPGTSTLPVIWNRPTMAWPAGRASFTMSTARPHCMAAGLALASMRAALLISSSGTHVISATFEGGYSCTRSASSSKP